MTLGTDDHDGHGATGGLRRGDVAFAIGAGLLALLVAVWSLRLWDWTMGTPFGLTRGTPFGLEGDSTFVSMELRDIWDHGWYWRNEDLGYPFGQNGSLFPELNVLHILLVKALGLLFSDPFSPGVAYFALGFPLAAVSMYMLARSQGLSRWGGLTAGVLFACAPGHQERFGHLWLAAYWVVPVGMWVVLEVLRGRSLLGRRTGGSWATRFLTVRSALVVAALTVLGLSGVYYVAFTLILLVFATIAVRWRLGRPSAWFGGLGSATYLVGVFLIPLAASRVGSADELVTGPVPASRSFVESELFAGKLMDLILPWQGHRLDPLSFLTFAYNASGHPTAETSALGVVALAGWVALLVVALGPLVTDRLAASELRRWSALSLVATAFYIVGGMGAFVALFFTPQLRTWSRFSLYLVLLGLLAVGWWVSRLQERRGVVTAGLVAVALTVVGVLDQTNPGQAPDHAAAAQRFDVLTAYARQLETATGPGCAVFQLPVVPFPESAGVGQMNGYDQLLPYLASKDLRFSSGAMRGTARADWQLGVDLEDPSALARELAAAGFCAVEVDSQGFTQDTDPRPRLEAALGAPVARSGDGVFTAYRLPQSGGDSRLRTRLLEPVIVALYAYEVRSRDDGSGVAQWIGPDVGLQVANLGSDTVPVSIHMDVEPAGDEKRELVVSDRSGRALVRAELDGGSTSPVDFTLEVPVGTTEVRLKTSGEPVRLLDDEILVSAQVSNLTVIEVQSGSYLGEDDIERFEDRYGR